MQCFSPVTFYIARDNTFLKCLGHLVQCHEKFSENCHGHFLEKLSRALKRNHHNNGIRETQNLILSRALVSKEWARFFCLKLSRPSDRLLIFALRPFFSKNTANPQLNTVFCQFSWFFLVTIIVIVFWFLTDFKVLFLYTHLILSIFLIYPALMLVFLKTNKYPRVEVMPVDNF